MLIGPRISNFNSKIGVTLSSDKLKASTKEVNELPLKRGKEPLDPSTNFSLPIATKVQNLYEE